MSAYIADILGLPSFTSTRGISVMAVMIISQTICHIALVFTIQRPDYSGRLFITGCIVCKIPKITQRESAADHLLRLSLA